MLWNNAKIATILEFKSTICWFSLMCSHEESWWWSLFNSEYELWEDHLPLRVFRHAIEMSTTIIIFSSWKLSSLFPSIYILDWTSPPWLTSRPYSQMARSMGDRWESGSSQENCSSMRYINWNEDSTLLIGSAMRSAWCWNKRRDWSLLITWSPQNLPDPFPPPPPRGG